MTLFDLVRRSMAKNIKHYYLYFFALILSVVLYFVFATLQYDSAVVEESGRTMNSAFKAAGILLLFIAGTFVVYANAIFLKRRSREIGLYQLIGLTKKLVARLLIVENVLLGLGALVIGIVIGLLVSRIFLLLLMKLIGYETFIELSFSMTAVIQTVAVFIGIFILTSLQMVHMVYRNTLLSLFNSDKKGEQPKKPSTWVAAFLSLLSILLIGFGYWLSARMMNELIFFNMLLVLATVILGTYLVFRFAISWLFYQFRKQSKGHLGLKNSLSLAPFMHRLKGNANSLTIITVLSAMTLTMLAGSYSLYYSTERDLQASMPFDFMFKNELALAINISSELDEQGIAYTRDQVEMLMLTGKVEEGTWDLPFTNVDVAIISDAQLQKAGIHVVAPKYDNAKYYDASMSALLANSVDFPFPLELQNNERTIIDIKEMGEGNVINWTAFLSQVVVNTETYEKLKRTLARDDQVEVAQIDGFHISEEDKQAASIVFQQPKYSTTSLHIDYYSSYQESIKSNGLFIFIAGFLGLVFLISTGSILYFKQMTEAEQEKQSYTTLRQLGFTTKDMMRGIIRKQAFVFGLPLAIGLMHSFFAIQAASFLFQSDITFPTTVAMSLYGIIYLLFALLTIEYYRNIVKSAV